MGKQSVQRDKYICLIGGLYLGFAAGYAIANHHNARKKETAELWQAVRELRKLNNLTAFTGQPAPTMEPMPVRIIDDGR